DAGDQGLGSWTIRAYNAAGAIADSTSTANGAAYTPHLSPGPYTICEGQQSGYTQSKPAGTDCKTLANDVADGGYPVSVSSSGTISGKDFGNFTTASVSSTTLALHDALPI